MRPDHDNSMGIIAMWGIVNSGVSVALRALGVADVDLQRAVSQAATGKAVAAVSDSPAAYVVAAALNSDAQAFMAVKSGLAGAEVPTRVATAAIDQTSDALIKLKAAVIQAQSDGASTSAYNTQIQSLLSEIGRNESDATVNGVNLLAGAVVNDVTRTQIVVPRNIDGANITIGEQSLSQMNASVPGLGLDNFTATSGGLNVSFYSLSAENIGTAAPATQVQLQTANYGNASSETGQYPGQSWTFVFTDASTPAASTDSNVVTDPSDNVTHVDHTIPVPLPVGFTLDDAISALQNSLNATKFESNYLATPPSVEPGLNIAGNNIDTAATGSVTVQNLCPTFPIPISGPWTTHTTSAVAAPATQITVGIAPRPSVPLPLFNNAIFLSTPADITAYTSSNPTVPAFYLSPSGAAISAGTTIASVSLTPLPIPQTTPPTLPTYTITLSQPPGSSIPAGQTIGLLSPLPAIPTATDTPWTGPEATIAILNSALRKTGDMSQTLGNAINSLQQAEDHATVSADLLDSGVGNMTDADMGKVSAQIQSGQIRQQLATQSLSLANQMPSLLLQLFK
jgi:flagellin